MLEQIDEGAHVPRLHGHGRRDFIRDVIGDVDLADVELVVDVHDAGGVRRLQGGLDVAHRFRPEALQEERGEKGPRLEDVVALGVVAESRIVQDAHDREVELQHGLVYVEGRAARSELGDGRQLDRAGGAGDGGDGAARQRSAVELAQRVAPDEVRGRAPLRGLT